MPSDDRRVNNNDMAHAKNSAYLLDKFIISLAIKYVNRQTSEQYKMNSNLPFIQYF